jgi:hypothetical protein
MIQEISLSKFFLVIWRKSTILVVLSSWAQLIIFNLLAYRCYVKSEVQNKRRKSNYSFLQFWLTGLHFCKSHQCQTKSHEACQNHTRVCSVDASQNPIQIFFCNLTLILLKSHIAWWNNTRPCQNYTRECSSHTHRCQNHSRVG